jgi:hypothetical protein
MANAKPADHTGRLKEQAAKNAAEEQAERASSMAMATAKAQIKLETEVIDATKPNLVPTLVVDDVITVGTEKEQTVIIRVIEDIDSMTFGAGNLFSFRAGQKYEVSKNLADHLTGLGYVARNI